MLRGAWHRATCLLAGGVAAWEAWGMLFPDTVVLVRGGGDLATGVAARLVRAGFPVVVTELAHPLTVRRSVALSTAVSEGSMAVEDIEAVRASPATVDQTIRSGQVPVLVSDTIPKLATPPTIVVDARLAKRNIDTARTDAPLVVTLGPGFEAGVDCDAVVETASRVIWQGEAEPNTGTPGLIGGKGRERVLRAPATGRVDWNVEIGSIVSVDDIIGSVGDHQVSAPFDGMVRGVIAESTPIRAGMKIGDVDPRIDPDACKQISDKALAVGGGVLEAVLTWLNRSN